LSIKCWAVNTVTGTIMLFIQREVEFTLVHFEIASTRKCFVRCLADFPNCHLIEDYIEGTAVLMPDGPTLVIESSMV